MTRDATIQVRLPSATKARIEAAAAAAGQSVTEYVVASALGGGPADADARYALARVVVGSVGDARAHTRALGRLRTYCEAGGLDPAAHADGAGDVWEQACVLLAMGER